MRFDQHDHILRRTAKPIAYPVTLEESKADTRDESGERDIVISSLIAAATDFMEGPKGAIGKAFITQTWELSVPCADRYGRLYLPVTPVKSIESIEYYDGNNQKQSLDFADFHLYGEEDWAYIVPRENKSWPTVYTRLDAITVTFKAGYGDNPSAIPDTVRQAIRMLVVHWYDNPGAVIVGASVAELPMAVQSLISVNRKGWVG